MDGYRYGFNGKENDQEIGTQDYGLRIYNPQLGKFLSVDPLSGHFPWNSPYSFAENDVIRCIDLDGGEKRIHTFFTNGNSTVLELVSHAELEKSGPMGDGELYIYHNTQTGKSTQFYYNEVNKGNILNETYVGPDNPVDYGQAPQDFVDYAAYRHDKAYDRHHAKGKEDANNNSDVLSADKELLTMSRQAIQMYKNDQIDPITGKQATYDLYVTGAAVEEWFDDIVEAKQKAMNHVVKQLKDSDKSVANILKEYNKANDTHFTTQKTRKDLAPTKKK